MVQIGSWGTPEFGITEKIQSIFAPNRPRTSQGGSSLLGNPGATSSVPAPINYSYMNRSNPVAQPVSQPSGGGSVQGASTQNYDQGAPYEQAPSDSGINWDEIYAPAFDALNQAEQAQQSSYQAGMGEVQSGYQQRTADLQQEQAARLANYGQQRQGETQRTEGAVAEARRMAAQLLQGLQSQFGGSTGTGAFRGEQIGAAATQNISGNRVALQTALTGIANSENALKDKVIQLQNAEDQNLQNSKLQLKAQLDQALAQISGQRGQLAADKGARRADALQQYKQLLAEVEARNTQFKQQLYTTAQEHARKLAELKTSAQDKYSANLKMANLTNGQQFNVGNKQYQVAPTSSGDIQYLSGTLNTNDDPFAEEE